jgi:hypothetical protein
MHTLKGSVATANGARAARLIRRIHMQLREASAPSLPIGSVQAPGFLPEVAPIFASEDFDTDFDFDLDLDDLDDDDDEDEDDDEVDEDEDEDDDDDEEDDLFGGDDEE